MYPHHVFNLEPAGTFRMYPICYQWVSGGYLQPEPVMYSRCFYWFPGPLAPSVMDDLPPVENTSPLPVPAPVFPGIIPFAVSTGQRCVPPKHLVRKVYHPYNDPVGQCRCEPGGWCDNLPCSGRKQCVSRKIRHWGRGGLEPVITC